jgi:hypothetical protein
MPQQCPSTRKASGSIAGPLISLMADRLLLETSLLAEPPAPMRSNTCRKQVKGVTLAGRVDCGSS